MRRRTRLLLAMAGTALLVLGIGGFVVGPFVSATMPLTNTARFPLGDPESVDTDAAGRVYVAEGFYHRVQRFTPDGEFEIGWHIDAVGPFRLRAMPDATIEVAVAGRQKGTSLIESESVMCGFCRSSSFILGTFSGQ